MSNALLRALFDDGLVKTIGKQGYRYYVGMSFKVKGENFWKSECKTTRN